MSVNSLLNPDEADCHRSFKIPCTQALPGSQDGVLLVVAVFVLLT
jgi:hypothetical protein